MQHKNMESLDPNNQKAIGDPLNEKLDQGDQSHKRPHTLIQNDSEALLYGYVRITVKSGKFALSSAPQNKQPE